MKRPMFFFADDGVPSGSPPAAPPAANTLLGDPGAPAPGAAPAPWIKEDGTFTEKWMEQVPQELRGEASLKVLQSFPDLVKSYVSTKAMVGKKLEMPGEGATPEALTAWRKVTGAPEKPEGYLGDAKTLRPESIPEGLWDTEAEKKFLAVAHKHHLPPQAVKDILAFHGEHLNGASKAAQEAEGTALEAEKVKLREAWGREHDANILLAERYAKTIGLDIKHPMFASADIVQAFARGAKLLSEDKLVRGEQGGSMASTVGDRIRDIQDPKSTSPLSREYRGEYGPERQKLAQDLLHQLMDSQQPQKVA